MVTSITHIEMQRKFEHKILSSVQLTHERIFTANGHQWVQFYPMVVYFIVRSFLNNATCIIMCVYLNVGKQNPKSYLQEWLCPSLALKN